MVFDVILYGGCSAGAICSEFSVFAKHFVDKSDKRRTVIVYGGVPLVGVSEMSVHCANIQQQRVILQMVANLINPAVLRYRPVGHQTLDSEDLIWRRIGQICADWGVLEGRVWSRIYSVGRLTSSGNAIRVPLQDSVSARRKVIHGKSSPCIFGIACRE